MTRDTDRNPEGEDRNGLRAQHESRGRQASPDLGRTNLTDRLGELVDRIQEGDRPLPWVVHTGCSYRRIASFPTREAGFRTFADGNVLHAYKQQPDGHPDLSMGERQLEALVEIVNAMPEILSALRKAEQPVSGDYAELVERLQRKARYTDNYFSNSSLGEMYREAATAIERLTARLVEEREENLWNAYHVGHVKDGRWTHMFMSDGEWLARQCGFDPRKPDYDDQEIRAAIPKAARLSLGDEK